MRLVLRAAFLRGNGVIHRTQKVIQVYSGRGSRRRRQSNRPLRKPRPRLKQNSRRRRQSNRQLSAAEVKRKKEEKRKREEPLDLLRSIHEEVHLQNTLEASSSSSGVWVQIPNMANPAGTTSLLQS